jgi:hypothetical protein
VQVQVEFQPDTYRGYDDAGLAHQLGRLGAMGYVGLERGRSEAYRRSRNLTAAELVEAERPSNDPKRRAYEQELSQVRGEGVSARGRLRLRTTGMGQWQVDIEPGTVRALTEDEFLDEIHSALRALLEDREAKIILVKSDHYDLGLPQRWLDVMRQLRAAAQR